MNYDYSNESNINSGEFREGTAELINGCDDTRATGIISAVTTVSIFDDGLTETPTNNLDWYTTGYIFLRYIIKQTLNYKPILPDDFKLPSVEVFEDTVAITTTQITDEQKTNLITKINEKYGTQLNKEAINIIDVAHTKGMDIIKPYIAPFAIATLVIFP